VRFSVFQVRFRCVSAFSQGFCLILSAFLGRTARGYKKVSHGCQEAVLEAGRSAGPSVAAALAAQGHFSGKAGKPGQDVRRNKERPGKFLEAERLSYVAAGKATFAETEVLSVVADAVHVGTDDWLNIFVCDPGQDLSFVCPQQAMREGGGEPFTTEVWFQTGFQKGLSLEFLFEAKKPTD